MSLYLTAYLMHITLQGIGHQTRRVGVWFVFGTEVNRQKKCANAKAQQEFKQTHGYDFYKYPDEDDSASIVYTQNATSVFINNTKRRKLGAAEVTPVEQTIHPQIMEGVERLIIEMCLGICVLYQRIERRHRSCHRRRINQHVPRGRG